MSTDALDLAVARHVTTTGMATPAQVAQALQEQARLVQSGTPVPLADALVKLGIITPTQKDTVEQKVKAQGGLAQQLLHFKLLKKLGEGGMGAVYLAEDSRNGRQVAIKVLPRKFAGEAELLTRFRREAEAAATLDHPNIVRAFETGEDLGWHFYVMEYCRGNTLDTHLKAEGRLAIPRALEITLQVARGLRFAHDRNLIHRDIKPANIMITADGTAKILDLGLAKNLAETENSFRTVSGAVLGTPHYISPEQAQGERQIDGRTDIYSLGGTLYHLLAGHPPFPGTTAVEIIYKHVHEQLPNPQDLREDIPDGVVQVLQRMMAKAPGDRFRDCAALITDLEQILRGESPKSEVLDAARSSVAVARRRPIPAGTRRVPITRRGVAPRRQNLGVFWGSLAGVAAIVAIVVFAFSGGKPDPEPVSVAAPARPIASKPPPAVPAADPWKDAPDLLKLVDPARDGVAGDWKRRLQGLISDGTPYARLEIPFVPPDEYDLRVAFTRPGGGEEVVLILSHWGKPFTFHLGAWQNQVCGFSTRAGLVRNAPSNATAARWIENDRVHTAVVEVRRDGLKALLDGKPLCSLKTDVVAPGMEPAWALKDPTILGVGSRSGPTVFHRAELRTISGHGREAGPRAAAGPEQAVAALLERLVQANPGFESRRALPRIEGGKLVGLVLAAAALKDVSPLRDLSGLEMLDLSGSGVSDLRPLRGLKLRSLSLDRTPVEDLKPLIGMPLAILRLANTPVRDFDPLREMPLTHVWLDVQPGRDAPILRSIQSLEQINGVPTGEFWKRSADPLPSAGVGEIRRYLGHSDPIFSVAFSPDGRRLLSASGDDTLRYWDGEAGREIGRIKGKATFYAAAFSADGRRAFGASEEKVIVVWDLETGKLIHRIDGWRDSIRALALSRDGRRLVAGGNDKSVRVFDAATFQELRRWEDGTAEIRTVDLSADGRRVLAAGEDTLIRIFEVEGKGGPRVLSPRMSGVFAAAFSPDGRQVAYGTHRGAGIWDLESDARNRMLMKTETRAVAWSPDGRKVLTGSLDTVLRLWDARSGAELERFTGHGEQIRGVAFSPDGTRALSGSHDGSIRLWSAAERPWRAIFDGKTSSFLRNPRTWAAEGGGLSPVPGVVDAGQTVETFDDGEIRIRMEWKKIDGLFFVARQNGEGGYSIFFDKSTLARMEGGVRELLIVARGPSVTATIDGQPWPIEPRNNTPTTRGCVQFNAKGDQFRLLSLEFRPLP